MRLLTISLILFLFNFSQVNLLAQEEETVDTIYIDNDFEINIDDELKELFELKDFSFKQKTHPFLKVNYGFTKFSHKSSLQKFNDVGNIELKLGYTRSKSKYKKYIFSVKERFVSINFNDKKYYKTTTKNPIELSNIQIGFGNGESFGYKMRNFKISFGTGKEFKWTKTSFNRMTIGKDTLILDFYRDAFRFGDASASDITLEFFDFIGLNFNYNYGIVFPRHLFWKHLGSLVLEEATRSILSNYLDNVFKMRPAAGPVINFILRSSLSYLFYELKKDKMNWPFNTVSPLAYDSYRIGLKLTF